MGIEEQNNIIDIFYSTGLLLDGQNHMFLEQNINASVLFNEDKPILKYFIENLEKIQIYEEPDCYLMLDNEKMIAIEVFQFDAGTSLKCGSFFEKRKDEIYKKSRGQVYYKEEYNINTSLNQYREALISIFNKHFLKIKKYKENLSKNFNINKSNIQMCFVIIDRTPCGCIYLKKQGERKIPYFYMPIFDKEFVAFLNQCQEVDFLLTCHNEEYLKSMRFISLSQKHLEYIKENIINDINPEDFYCWDASLIVQSSQGKTK